MSGPWLDLNEWCDATFVPKNRAVAVAANLYEVADYNVGGAQAAWIGTLHPTRLQGNPHVGKIRWPHKLEGFLLPLPAHSDRGNVYITIYIEDGSTATATLSQGGVKAGWSDEDFLPAIVLKPEYQGDAVISGKIEPNINAPKSEQDDIGLMIYPVVLSPTYVYHLATIQFG